ncbi:MAG: hypothetical protein ACLSGB_01515 [Dorea sp.]
MEVEHVTHEFKPIYNKESKVLMLGTMPSPKSREVGFYYGHPRNRFWKVLSDVCGEEVPATKRKIKSHLPCAMHVASMGMYWQAVRFGEQMTAASVIQNQMT